MKKIFHKTGYVLLASIVLVLIASTTNKAEAKPKRNFSKIVIQSLKTVIAKPKLAAGIYPCFYSQTCNHCCLVPANNCILIVINSGVKQYVEGEGIGPALNKRPSVDPAWQWEADLIGGDMTRWNE